MGAGKDLWAELVTRYNKDHSWGGVVWFYASDAIYTDPNGRFEWRSAIQAYLEAAEKSFSDQRLETLRLIEESDTTVAEYTWRASHAAPLATPDGIELPATSKPVEIPGLSIFVVKNGKIATQRDYFDNAGVMSQLGLMPS